MRIIRYYFSHFAIVITAAVIIIIIDIYFLI